MEAGKKNMKAAGGEGKALMSLRGRGAGKVREVWGQKKTLGNWENEDACKHTQWPEKLQLRVDLK